MESIKYQRVSEEENEASRHSISNEYSSCNAKYKCPSKNLSILDGISTEVKVIRDKLKPFMYIRKPLANLEWRDIVTDHDKNKYLGQWNKRTNTKEGIGILVDSSGGIYEGYWKNNMANGEGRYIYSCGDYYEGDWVDGNKHGNGTYCCLTKLKLFVIIDILFTIIFYKTN